MRSLFDSTNGASSGQRVDAVVIAVLSFLPLWFCRRSFGHLFWFGDDWDLVSQIERVGFFTWFFQVFAENFVPVFKVIWAGSLVFSGGDYFLMLLPLWLFHAWNVYLLGKLMCLCKVGTGIRVVVLVFFAFSPTNWETLSWSVQLSAIMATTFFLFGLTGFFARFPKSGWGLVLCATLSALSFSRGVMSGLSYAGALVVSRPREALRFWWVLAGIILPSFAVAGLIFLLSRGNHTQALDGGNPLVAMVEFALYYFGGNPFWILFGEGLPSRHWVMMMAFAKMALFVWTLRSMPTDLRGYVWTLLLFETGNAFLLGLGRYHTGLESALSARYQYSSLVAILPPLAMVLQSIPGVRGRADTVRARWISATFATVLMVWCLFEWRQTLRAVESMRGTDIRDALVDGKPEDPMPHVPFVTVGAARELSQRFGFR